MKAPETTLANDIEALVERAREEGVVLVVVYGAVAPDNHREVRAHANVRREFAREMLTVALGKVEGARA